MKLGEIRFKEFLDNTKGEVCGKIVTDAKHRWYSSKYNSTENGNDLLVFRSDGNGDKVRVPQIIELDEQIVGFLGLYSGDGAKGSEDASNPNKIKPQISFSQREPNLIKFAVDQFRRIFPGKIRFTFSLGEDSAFFMTGEGEKLLKKHYRGNIPDTPSLKAIKRKLNAADERYLKEKRPVAGKNEDHLAFYYFHKTAMEEIFIKIKSEAVLASGIHLGKDDKITASLRRPFKKGARQPGGSSRSDELHVGGLNGIGELFLKIMHEVEDSIIHDSQVSTQGLIHWEEKPSEIGEVVDLKEFYKNNPYGQINKKRPKIIQTNAFLKGKWKASREIILSPTVRLNSLWCYTAGLYLAEGSTAKSKMFSMFRENPKGMALSFTSSEGDSLDLMLRILQSLFQKDDCMDFWKIKVGSQYFPELVVLGLKHGVPMLRGGKSGDGKLRTMEISLACKEWALSVAKALRPFAHKFSHVEPTGAGVARIDFSASSTLCRWYFPLLIYSIFGKDVSDPLTGFLNE